MADVTDTQQALAFNLSRSRLSSSHLSASTGSTPPAIAISAADIPQGILCLNPGSIEDSTITGRRLSRRACLRAGGGQAPVRRKTSGVKVAKRFFSHTASSLSRTINPNSNSMPSVTLEDARAGPIGGGISGIPSHAQSLLPPQTARPRSRSINALRSTERSSLISSPEKPLASTSGGTVSLSIVLAEPVLFLRGYDQTEHSERSSAMLRGSLVVRVTKPTKIKAIQLVFRGRIRTEWPEGTLLAALDTWRMKAYAI